MSTPPRSARSVVDGRLVYFELAAEAEHWERLWARTLVPDFYQAFADGDLHYLTSAFERHLPRTGRILEAGCGTGQWVLALKARGYQCVGLDYAQRTLQTVKAARPELPLIGGDMHLLPFRDGAFDAVVSLGVVEHLRVGPEALLREMARVTATGGVVFVSVPSFNLLRRTRWRLGGFRDDPGGLDFYQYAFGDDEFERMLRSVGLKPIAARSYDIAKTFRQDVPGYNLLPRTMRRVVERLAAMVPALHSRIGHMRLFIARRDTDDA